MLQGYSTKTRRMRIVGPYYVAGEERYTLVIERFNPGSPEKVTRDERYPMTRDDITELFNALAEIVG